MWVAALELRGCWNFQTPYRTVLDGAGLTSLMRNEPRGKEGKAAVAEAVVAAVGKAADGTASGNAETVPPGTEAPATEGGGCGPDEASPLLRRFSTHGSACLLRRYEIVHLEGPTPAEWPLLIALSAYAVDHVDASLLPAWRKPGSDALACVWRKLRDAAGRMRLPTLPSVFFHVSALTRSRGMHPSPVSRTARIAMLLDGNFAAALRDSSVGVWRVSPPPRRRTYRQARRRRPLPTPSPLVALPPPPCVPAPYPPPHEWYVEK